MCRCCENDVSTEGTTQLNAHGIGRRKHDDFRADARRCGGECDGRRMVAGTHGDHAVFTHVFGKIEHIEQRTARFERAGVLEQLELEPNIRVLAHRSCNLVTAQAMHRSGYDIVRQAASRGAYFVDRKCMNRCRLRHKTSSMDFRPSAFARHNDWAQKPGEFEHGATSPYTS
jgi:hypothetical protein